MKGIPNDPRLRPGTDFCRCMACGAYFRRSGTFGRHRAGTWADQGTHRHCLTPDEMAAQGWLVDERGYWMRAKRREPLRAKRLSPIEPPGCAFTSGA
jgi:hypothetical protein